MLLGSTGPLARGKEKRINARPFWMINTKIKCLFQNENSALALFCEKNVCNLVNFLDIFTFLGPKGLLTRGENICIRAN